MKRIMYGALWFALIFFAGYSLGGFLYVHMTGTEVTGGFEAGRQAGDLFRETWAPYILAGAAVISLAGTITGILPGTKEDRNK